MLDVITMGAAVKDVFLTSPAFQLIRSPKFEHGVGECVSFGAKIEVDNVVHATGGGATNAAVTFARLGLKTSCIAKIGNDGPGREIIDDLKNEGVDASRLKVVARGQTGYSTILTAQNGERSILVSRGVSGSLAAADFPASLKSRAIYLTTLGHLSVATNVVNRAAKTRALIFMNPGTAEISKKLSAFAPLLRHLDVLMLNVEEATRLTGLDTRDPKALLLPLCREDLTVILTDGQNGAFAWDQGQIYFVRARPLKAISRTGAGDAFGSGFMAGRLKGLSTPDCLRLAQLNAESVIKYLGAKRGLLRRLPSERVLAAVTVRPYR